MVITALKANYPVRAEVANLIQKDPNIIAKLDAKYDIASLEQERASLINTSIYKLDKETGEIEEDEGVIGSVAGRLSTQIEMQKSERRNYLQSLLRNSIVGE